VGLRVYKVLPQLKAVSSLNVSHQLIIINALCCLFFLVDLSSDCEGDGSSQPEEPKVETMGVAEKIKAFLDNLQHFSDFTPRPRLKSKKLPFRDAQSKTSVSRDRDAPLENDPLRLRTSRHSSCFLPSSQTSKRSPNPIKKVVNSPKAKLSDALGKKSSNKTNSSVLTIMAHNNKSSNADKRRHLSGDSVVFYFSIFC
jgi:hypothetical protein